MSKIIFKKMMENLELFQTRHNPEAYPEPNQTSSLKIFSQKAPS